MTPSQTEFAGYELLSPGDPLSSDGYAFQSRNPLIADFMAKLGAILHKHDAHAAMANPTVAPTLTVSGSGGSIPAGTTVYVEYTLTDGQGGESLPTTVEQVTVPTVFSAPTGAPTAVVNYTAGTMLAGTPMYALSVTDGMGGETVLGPPVSVTISPTPGGSAEVVLSGFTAITNAASGSSTSAGWRLWRSMDGGNDWDFMASGAYSTDGFTDNGSVAGDCSQSPQTVGTTGNTGSFTVTVPSAGQPAAATFFTVYACTDGLFYSPSLLGTYPVSDFASTLTFTSLPLQTGRPPAQSLCVGGANQIDPDTDILNWPWKQPVATASALPTSGNTNGDVRETLDTHTVYTWNAGTSTWAPSVGAPGPAGPPASAQVTVNAVAGDTYTLQLSDAGIVIEMTSDSSGGTLTIPTNASVAFPLETVLQVCQTGVGQVNVVGASGVTVDSPGGLTHTAMEWATIGLRKRGTNEWVLSGKLA